MFNNKEMKKESELAGSLSSTNIIGTGTIIEGNIKSAGNIRIEGEVRGNIHVQAKLVVAEKSVCQGDIVAQNAEISGKVMGKVQVSELLVLKSTALIQGDIQTVKLSIEPGAGFNGKCSMGNTSQLVSENNKKTISHE